MTITSTDFKGSSKHIFEKKGVLTSEKKLQINWLRVRVTEAIKVSNETFMSIV